MVGFSSIQKYTAVMRTIAYETHRDGKYGYVRIGDSTAIESIDGV
jgi:hypothetical protein